jgi:hypothetical protein
LQQFLILAGLVVMDAQAPRRQAQAAEEPLALMEQAVLVAQTPQHYQLLDEVVVAQTEAALVLLLR